MGSNVDSNLRECAEALKSNGNLPTDAQGHDTFEQTKILLASYYNAFAQTSYARVNGIHAYTEGKNEHIRLTQTGHPASASIQIDEDGIIITNEKGKVTPISHTDSARRTFYNAVYSVQDTSENPNVCEAHKKHNKALIAATENLIDSTIN